METDPRRRDPGMTLQVCADLLRDHDADRFGAVLAAAPDDRPALITLYALNLELARAPFQSNEPMLAEMRLQWWIDRLTEMGQGTAPPLHDVLTPLWEVWGPRAGDLVPLAEARRRDCAREPFATQDEVLAYVDATAGGLMWAAAQALGAGPDARTAVAGQARGAGLAAWLRALPELRGLGLGVADPQAVVGLAASGQAGFDQAAAQRRHVPRRAAAALYAGPGARAFLRDLQRNGGEVTAQARAVSPFRKRASLARLALTGGWWQ